MDYRDTATFRVHSDLESWRSSERPDRVFAFTVDGEGLYSEMAYRPGDVLLFGPESVGLPDEVQTLPWIDARVRLPMVPEVRSINLSNSAAIVVYEAWRQNGFKGSR